MVNFTDYDVDPGIKFDEQRLLNKDNEESVELIK